jgi:hypothetical protein
MNDFIAGSPSGTSDDSSGPWGGGSVPTVLLVALGVAVLIAVTIVAFLVGSGSGGGGSPVPAGAAGVDDPGRAGTPVTEGRVLLTISIEGGGSGRVRLEPRGLVCTETCNHQVVAGSRVTLTADAVEGSRFEGWDDACTGSGRCSFVMDRERSVTATFEGTPVTQCQDGRDNDHDGFVDGEDPGCRNDDTEAPDNTPTDCSDGRDNDGDGLVDSAQDPGCAGDGTEADSGATTTAPAPVPVPPPQTTTTPAPAPPPPTTVPVPAGTPPVSECHDGIDNDGDRKTDRPADPGCDADGTEAGG